MFISVFTASNVSASGSNFIDPASGSSTSGKPGIVYPNGKFLGNIIRDGTVPANFRTYWNQVTPENAGKWGEVERSQSHHNWSTLDFIYNYAKSNGMPFKMHNFIWGMQQPQWIDSLTTTDQTTAIIDWISNVGARYPDMDCIDVVNEPFHNPPSYIKAMGGNGSTGWDWVVFAYKLARKYCPKAKLLLNEYNLERSPAFCAEFTNLVMILKASNLIDGIGLQSHNKDIAGISRETFSNSLSVLASTGLPIYISELDLSGPVDSIQLDQYKKYFPMLWNYPAVKGITLWGYIDGEMWTSDAGLLEPDGKEREALTWLTNYVRTAH